jgi:hypothetical protein
MMSQQSKKEVIESVRGRYLKASKAEKQKILDELTSTTGYNRKYAIRVLRHPKRSKGLSSSTISSSVIAWKNESPLPDPDLITRMTKLMWNRRIGVWFAIRSAMTVLRARLNWLC